MENYLIGFTVHALMHFLLDFSSVQEVKISKYIKVRRIWWQVPDIHHPVWQILFLKDAWNNISISHVILPMWPCHSAIKRWSLWSFHLTWVDHMSWVDWRGAEYCLESNREHTLPAGFYWDTCPGPWLPCKKFVFSRVNKCRNHLRRRESKEMREEKEGGTHLKSPSSPSTQLLQWRRKPGAATIWCPAGETLRETVIPVNYQIC